ncbi:lipocalin [Gouania willdenowi]|uniref:lipocalin n=1 Tax=Gouania willdenowi TaxID=441366 RepID=UPI001054A345|nr:lipocalin-like [Gouania willdenowi]
MMSSSLLTLLGALLCSMMVSSDVQPQADFNIQGMAGKWYLIGFATNGEWFVSRRDSMKMGTSVFTPTSDGDVDISYASLSSDGSCWRMNNLAKKTDIPGKFTYTSQRSGSFNNMHFVDVKYDEYALTHTIKTEQSENTAVNKLYGRGEDLSESLKEKFKTFSLESGILPENIVILPRNTECPAV